MCFMKRKQEIVSIKKLTVLFVLFQLSLFVVGQTKVVEGKVTAFNKYPLENIDVVAKKSKAKAITDQNGFFKIEVKGKDILVIKNPLFSAYEAKILKNTSNLEINLIFIANDKNDRHAVEKGFFTRDDLDFALKNLNRENNIYSLYNDVYEAIKYTIPEAQMVESETGIPYFILRGKNSIQGKNSALYVVNNNVVGDISYIVTADIKKIWKLSNSKTAMYGSRAGNGVICIETY